jgi:hypothetical protein
MRADCDHLAERLLATTKYQGFPVTRSDTDKTLLGDISRRDLEIAIGASSFFRSECSELQ